MALFLQVTFGYDVPSADEIAAEIRGTVGFSVGSLALGIRLALA